MFYTLLKNVDGRKSYRHFNHYENAEREMLEDIENIKKHYGAIKVRDFDFFKADKGIYIREIELRTPENMSFTYAVLDAYFEDEE